MLRQVQPRIRDTAQVHALYPKQKAGIVSGKKRNFFRNYFQILFDYAVVADYAIDTGSATGNDCKSAEKSEKNNKKPQKAS